MLPCRSCCYLHCVCCVRRRAIGQQTQMTNDSNSDLDVSFRGADSCYAPSATKLQGFLMVNESRRRVLVIEDDQETGAQIVDYLKTNGFDVDIAATGDEGLRLAFSTDYAVITIDRMLPGVDGLSIIRRLRERDIATPALIISALGEVDDRVRGLRAGGDDYLVKPFAFVELLARIDALARRSVAVAKDTVLRVGDLKLDLVSHTVTRHDREIDLLPREFQVLEFLVRNEGHVVPRATLLQHVWDLHFDPTTNIIDVYVGRVRRKIDSSQDYPLIHTIRGVGFCLRAPC